MSFAHITTLYLLYKNNAQNFLFLFGRQCKSLFFKCSLLLTHLKFYCDCLFMVCMIFLFCFSFLSTIFLLCFSFLFYSYIPLSLFLSLFCAKYSPRTLQKKFEKREKMIRAHYVLSNSVRKSVLTKDGVHFSLAFYDDLVSAS